MLSDRPYAVSRTGAPSFAESVYPLTRLERDQDVVAVRAQRPIRREAFLRDVAALSARLPDRPYVLNLCSDRYRFMVGFGAALCRNQVSLLPPSSTPATLCALKADYPDLYALADKTSALAPTLTFPNDLDHAGAVTGVPAFPGTQPAIILFTSGSTGKPKPVPKSWGVLVRSALSAGARLGMPRLEGATLIGTVPHQHSYGLESMVLLGLQHGAVVDAGQPFYPADVRSALEATQQPRILVTTPVHLKALVAEPGGMPQADLVLSATAPLPVLLAAQTEACFRAPLLEIYGCTEAGQVASRRTVQEPHWHSFDGVDLRMDAQGMWASGAAVEGRVLLHDIIEEVSLGRFLLGGRSADLVDVAGKRTSLAYLNHHLLSIDGVVDGVFVVPETDGSHFTRMAALVVAPNVPHDEILRELRERIDAAFLPRPLVFIDSLPRDPLGKLPREALLQLIERGRST
jgi:acyl-coenzyme A synthetase/AMP-(fatty) acid ligase